MSGIGQLYKRDDCVALEKCDNQVRCSAAQDRKIPQPWPEVRCKLSGIGVIHPSIASHPAVSLKLDRFVGRHVITRIHLLPMLIKVSGSFVLHMPMTVPDYTLPACLSTNSVQFLMESKSCRPFNTQEVPLHFSLSCNLKGEIMLSKLNNKLWLAVSLLIQERNGYPPGPGSLWINLWLTKKFCDCWLSPWMIFRIFQGCH